MKRAMTVLGAGLVVLSAVTVAEAFDAAGTKVTVSLKAWQNSWEEKDELDDGSTEKRDFGSSLMVGPALTVRAGKVLLGASYLVPLEKYEPDASGGDPITYGRKDLDLTATFMFVPRFGAFVGYKSIDSPITVKETGDDFGSLKLKGPGVGVTGNIPLGRAAALYGSLAVMRLEKEYSSTSREFGFDMTGASLDLGLAYAFTPAISASVGVKGQSFSGDDDAGFKHTSTYTGATLGLNFTF